MATTRCVPCCPFCHLVRSPHGMNPKPRTSPIARIIDLVGQTKPRLGELQGYEIMHIRNQQTQIYIIDNLIINPQFIGSWQTHRKRRLHQIDIHEDHGELCIEDPRERRSHLVTSYGPVGLWWTTHASSERSWCWWRSPTCPNPLRQGTRTCPRWDLAETEACGVGKVISRLPDFLEYLEFIGEGSR